MGTVEDAIRIATKEIGYRETGNNLTKYNQWLGVIPGYPHNGYGYPWCNSFTSWVYHKAGLKAGVDYPKTASCLTSVAWYKQHKRWGKAPRIGAQVMYGPGGKTHTEIVVAVSSTHITTIGGNTSGSLGGQYFNGDGVYKKKVARNESRIYGYGYPNFKQEDDLPSVEEVWRWDGLPAPRSASTYETNPTWTAWGYFRDTNERIRALQAMLRSHQATTEELVKTVSQLAADRGQVVDEDAIIQRITEKIESIEVELRVKE